MISKIKNSTALLSHGAVSSRQLLLEITEELLQKLDAYEQITRIMRLEGDILWIGKKSWDLSKKKNIYLIGAGKACNHMARAVDTILGDRLTRGIAIVKIAEPEDIFHKTEVYVGGHPLPNEEGYRASLKIIDLIDHATKDDLFITVISGGSSALMSCPLPGISLDDEIQTTDTMLKSGADIYEINAIRRHISSLNGGRLAQRIRAIGAEMIGIGISDGGGIPPTADIEIPFTNYKGTPIGPDNTTLEFAKQTINNYGVKDRLPSSVVNYLFSVGEEGETPKAFPENTYYLLNSVPDSSKIAKEIASSKGIKSYILTTGINGESKEIGLFLSSLAKEIQEYGNPVSAPCLIIASGETYTTIPDSSVIRGHGGPSQELTLGFALTANKVPGAAILSIDTEGTDGTTPVAGALTDSFTMAAIEEKGIDAYAMLRGHAAYETLSAVSDVIITGNTGTNLCDFDLMYIPQK